MRGLQCTRAGHRWQRVYTYDWKLEGAEFKLFHGLFGVHGKLGDSYLSLAGKYPTISPA